MESPLTDIHGRAITYVRLSVTDRCNLRCTYCMPEKGMKFASKSALLQTDEIIRLMNVLVLQGVSKVRITGGEPLMRPDIQYLLQSLKAIKGLKELHLTTNGLLLNQHLPFLTSLPIDGINISLDTLNPERFFKITRKNAIGPTLEALDAAIEAGIKVKVNAVALRGFNDSDLASLAGLAKEKPISVRFIEEMPFNGKGQFHEHPLTYKDIKNTLEKHFTLTEFYSEDPSETAKKFRIDGFIGSVGIISAYSRTFCGSCNRIRINAEGQLKTCLYAEQGYSLRDALRKFHSDKELWAEIKPILEKRPKDGFEAEKSRRTEISKESMSQIGG